MGAGKRQRVWREVCVCVCVAVLDSCVWWRLSSVGTVGVSLCPLLNFVLTSSRGAAFSPETSRSNQPRWSFAEKAPSLCLFWRISTFLQCDLDGDHISPSVGVCNCVDATTDVSGWTCRPRGLLDRNKAELRWLCACGAALFNLSVYPSWNWILTVW